MRETFTLFERPLGECGGGAVAKLCYASYMRKKNTKRLPVVVCS